MEFLILHVQEGTNNIDTVPLRIGKQCDDLSSWLHLIILLYLPNSIHRRYDVYVPLILPRHLPGNRLLLAAKHRSS